MNTRSDDSCKIQALAVFVEMKRKEYGISMNSLCQAAHISKKTYIAFRGASDHR